MPIEYLIVWSYGISVFFFMSVIAGLGIVSILRRTRLEKIYAVQVSNTQTLPHRLRLRQNSLEDMKTWDSEQLAASIRDTATITQLPTEPPVVPLRYQQTLLYADDVNDPHNDIETKPATQPQKPAIPSSS